MNPAVTLVAADWLAAGVRHEILMRVLPTLRHDLLGPISVARMELAVMRRRLEREDLSPQDGLRRVQQLESHLIELTRGLRELRRWDGMADEQMPAGSIVALAIGLMEQPLRLAGIVIDSTEVERDAGASLPLGPLLLGTLAMLCHAQDHLAAGSRLRIGFDASAVRLELQPLAPLDAAQLAPELPRASRSRVDAEAVRHLAASLGLHAVLDAESWLLRPAEARAPAP